MDQNLTTMKYRLIKKIINLILGNYVTLDEEINYHLMFNYSRNIYLRYVKACRFYIDNNIDKETCIMIYYLLYYNMLNEENLDKINNSKKCKDDIHFNKVFFCNNIIDDKIRNIPYDINSGILYKYLFLSIYDNMNTYDMLTYLYEKYPRIFISILQYAKSYSRTHYTFIALFIIQYDNKLTNIK